MCNLLKVSRSLVYYHLNNRESSHSYEDSEIDNILSRDMDDVLEELALHVDVKDALLGVQNPIRKMLDKVILFETNTEWKTDENTPETLTADLVMEKYIAALGWVLESGYN